jgi:hypothetical protein
MAGSTSGGTRATEAEVARLRAELEALRGRKIVRLALLVAELLRRPWRLRHLPRRLAAALRGGGASSPGPARGGSKRGPLRLRPPAGRLRYPHLRLAHVGRRGPYASLATHEPLPRDGWRESLEAEPDLLLVGPGTRDLPLGEVLAVARELGVPSVLRLEHRDDLDLLTMQAGPDLVVVEEPGLAEAAAAQVPPDRLLRLQPATDLRRCNPVGWIREPEHPVMLAVMHDPDPSQTPALLELLDAAGGPVAVVVGPGVDPDRLPEQLTRGDIETVDGVGALAETARNHRMALAHPAVHATPTTFARHVLDLLACGTPVIHPPAPVLERLLPTDLRREASTGAEVATQLEELTDPDVRERVSVTVRRHVLTHHTTLDRFDEILDRLGIPTAVTPAISVLLSTTRPELLEHAHAQIARQDHPRLQVITICHGDGFDDEQVARAHAQHDHPTLTLHAPAHWTLGDALNLGLDHATGQLVAKMDDDDHYGPGHLSDLLLAMTYSRADVVGKLANFVHLSKLDVTIDRYLVREESFVWHLPGATMLIHRELLAAYRFPRVRSGVDTALYTRLHADGARRYSTHRFNFIRHRGDQHTYARTDQEFLDQAEHTHPGLARDRAEV